MDVKDIGKVAVLLGGMSAEREISLKSGEAVLAALRVRGVDAHAVDVNRDIVTQLQHGHYDRAFPILHGRGGEDGSIQAVLEFLDIPYCGSGVASSALAMDKARTKWVWLANNLPTPKFCLLKKENELKGVDKILKLPIAVKPLHEGSSLGIVKLKSWDGLLDAFRNAKQYHDEVLLEEWVEGDEYTVSIVGDDVFPSIKISTPREFYDYQAKYFVHTTEYDCPSDLNQKAEAEIRLLSKKAFDVLGCRDWGRVDFMRDAKGRFWLIELNTIPGMTETSLVPKAGAAHGVEFADLVLTILTQGMEDA